MQAVPHELIEILAQSLRFFSGAGVQLPIDG